MIHKILQTKENIELDILSDIDDDNVYKIVIESLKHETTAPYSTLLETIFHYKISESEAKRIWSKILKSQKKLSDSLKRKVSIKTAVVDYFSTIGLDDHVLVFIKENMVNVFDAATRDGLTGLYSHEYIENDLDKEYCRAKRYKLPLSLLFIDIDNFKLYNDTFGHKAGDRALAAVARILKESIRKTDKAGRFGGEEFVVILPHTVRANALKIAKKMVRLVEGETAEDGALPRGLTVSIGAAGMLPEMKESEDLLTAADKAMYRAKNMGKNRCCAG